MGCAQKRKARQLLCQALYQWSVTHQAAAEILAQYQPPVVSFHFGLPSLELVTQIKAWGGLVISSATTLEEALWLEQHGADMVIAQGIEAGYRAHRGIQNMLQFIERFCPDFLARFHFKCIGKILARCFENITVQTCCILFGATF